MKELLNIADSWALPGTLQSGTRAMDTDLRQDTLVRSKLLSGGSCMK